MLLYVTTIIDNDFAGKYYFEATVTDEGLCRVGWSTSKARLDLGTDREGFGFGGTGKKSNSKQFDSYGEVNIGFEWLKTGCSFWGCYHTLI